LPLEESTLRSRKAFAELHKLTLSSIPDGSVIVGQRAVQAGASGEAVDLALAVSS
jgi:hypothetical protein